MNRSRIRHASAKHAREQRQRVARLRATIDSPVRCQWPDGCASEAVDAHESLKRSQGGDPLDPDWFLCRPHHDAITNAHGDLLAWAREVGLVRSGDTPWPSRSRSVHDTVAGMAEPRKPIHVRVSPEADEWVDKMANRHDVSRAVVVRAMLSVATSHADDVTRKIRNMAEVDRPSTPSTRSKR